MGPVSSHRYGDVLVLAHLHQVKELSTELTILCVLHHLSFAEDSELKPAEELAGFLAQPGLTPNQFLDRYLHCP